MLQELISCWLLVKFFRSNHLFLRNPIKKLVKDLFQLCVGNICILVLSHSLLGTRTETCWCCWCCQTNASPLSGWKELSLFCPEKGRRKGDLTAGYSWLVEGWRESGARPLPKLDRGRGKEKRYKMEHGKIQLGMTEVIFTMKVVKYCSRSLERCGISIL